MTSNNHARTLAARMARKAKAQAAVAKEIARDMREQRPDLTPEQLKRKAIAATMAQKLALPRFKRHGPNTFAKGPTGTGSKVAGHKATNGQAVNWVAFGALVKCRKVRRWRATIALPTGYFNEVKRKIAKRKTHLKPFFVEPENCLFDNCSHLGTKPQRMAWPIPADAYAQWDARHGMNWDAFLGDWHYDKKAKAWVGKAGVHTGGVVLHERTHTVQPKRQAITVAQFMAWRKNKDQVREVTARAFELA